MMDATVTSPIWPVLLRFVEIAFLSGWLIWSVQFPSSRERTIRLTLLSIVIGINIVAMTILVWFSEINP